MSMLSKSRMEIMKFGTVFTTEPVGIRGNQRLWKTYCWDIHMVIDDNDGLHLAYTTYTELV